MRLLVLLPLLATASADALEGIKASKQPTISMPPSSWWPFSGSATEVNKELLDAAQHGHLSRVKAALENGADLAAVDKV